MSKSAAFRWAEEVEHVADELAAEVLRLRDLAVQLRTSPTRSAHEARCIAAAERVLHEEPVSLPLASDSLPPRQMVS